MRDAHLVVNRKPAIAPAEHARAKLLRDRSLLDHKIQHRAAKAALEQPFRDRRQGGERAVRPGNAVGGENMYVGWNEKLRKRGHRSLKVTLRNSFHGYGTPFSTTVVPGTRARRW